MLTRARRSLSEHQQRWLERVAWCTPLLAFLLVKRVSPERTLWLMAVIVGVCALAILATRPGLAVTALCVGFPVAEILLPLALRLGVPTLIVRTAGSWKELLVGALVVAAVRRRQQEPVPLDRLDLLGLGFLAVLAVYYVLPGWLPTTDLVIPAEARSVAARTLGLPVIALLAVRRLTLGPEWRRRASHAIVLTGVLIGIGAIVEITSPSTWTRFLEFLDVNRYQSLVFGNHAERTFIFSDTTLSGDKTRRAGSLFGSHLDTSFALLLPLAVTLHHLRRTWTAPMLVSAGTIGAGLALTQTRSAILGGALIAVGALRSESGPASGSRVRTAMWMGLAALVMLPLVANTALADRVTGAITGEDKESTPEHTERSRAAFDAVVDRPLGQGLGSSGGIANRFAVPGRLLPENHYLRVALDVGVVGGALFAGLVITGSRWARRRAATTGSVIDASVAGAVAALAVAGLFLDTFDAITSSLPLFVALGLATSPAVLRPRYGRALASAARAGP